MLVDRFRFLVRSPITIDLVDARKPNIYFCSASMPLVRSRLPSISLQALGFVSDYLSRMSLAVSVPRMRSLYIAMMPRRGLPAF